MADLGERILLDPCWSDDPTAEPGAADGVELVLLEWWRLSHGLPLTESVGYGELVPSLWTEPATYQRVQAAAERLHRLDRVERDRWFVEHAGQVRGCGLTWADLP